MKETQHMRITRKQFISTGASLALAATIGGLGATAANAAPTNTNSAPAASAVSEVTVQRFTDVPDNLMFAKEINWLKEAGVANGWSDGSFRPHEQTQRAASIAFLYRLHGAPDVALPEASPFKDVDPSNPFYKEIVWAYNVGITTGYPDGTFRPWDSVSREALAAFMYRSAGSPAVNQEYASKFKDVSGSQFKDAIAWMAQNRISTGWSDGTFRPHEAANRDATAAFLYRYAMAQHTGA